LISKKDHDVELGIIFIVKQ